jgi:hypothetical protein
MVRIGEVEDRLIDLVDLLLLDVHVPDQDRSDGTPEQTEAPRQVPPALGTDPQPVRLQIAPGGWNPSLACAKAIRSWSRSSTPSRSAIRPAPFPLPTPIQIVVNFIDPDPDETHTAIIDWGDGTTSIGIVTQTVGGGIVTGEHVYAQPGEYQITVTIIDKAGETGQVSTPAESVNVPPIVHAPATFEAVPVSGQIFVGAVIQGQFSDPAFGGSGSGIADSFTVSRAGKGDILLFRRARKPLWRHDPS